MTGKNKGKLIIISNVKEQCKTDCEPGQCKTDCEPGQCKTDCEPGECKTDCKPGRKRTSSHDVDFDKTSIQQLFKFMKFENKIQTGLLQCQTGEVCLLYFVQRKKKSSFIYHFTNTSLR